MRSSTSVDFLLQSAVVVLTLSACAQQRPQTTNAGPQPVHEPAKTTQAEFWIPRIVPGSQKYFVTDSSIVSINNDTTNRVMPIETTINYSLIIGAAGDSFSITGRVDSSSVSSQLPTKVQVRDSTKIEEIHATLTKYGKLQLDSQERLLTCSGSSNSMTSRIYELLTPYPKAQLKIGDQWSDTISSTSCHGKTPLTQQIIRQYQVKGFTTWHDHMAIEVQRQINMTFSGGSSEPNTHLQATGSGSGDAIIFLDRAKAVLLESTGRTKASLTITTSRGVFPFTQVTSTHIVTQ